MATRESTARYATPIQFLANRLPQPVWPVIMVPILAFAVAFAVDVATDRRFSQIWGSLALLASAGVIPAVRRAAVPVAAYAGVWVGFNALRAFADDAGIAVVSRGAIGGLESSIFAGELPSAFAQRSVVDPSRVGVVQLALTAVYLSFFVVPHIVGAVLLVRNRALFWKLIAASALLFGVGVVAFALAPTDPPWLAASRDPGLGDVDRLPRFVLSEFGVPFGEGTGTAQGYGFEPNPLASMPSIHLGVTVLIAAAAWRSGVFWRGGGIAYAAAMGIALVVSGEHYVLDVVAGTVLAVAAWMLIDRIRRRRAVTERSAAAHVQSGRRAGRVAPGSSGRAFGRGT